MTKNTVFVVFSYGGQYEDKWELIDKIFYNEKDAKDYIERMRENSSKYFNMLNDYNKIIDNIADILESNSKLEDTTEEKHIFSGTFDEFIKFIKTNSIKTNISEEDLRFLFSRFAGDYAEDFDDTEFPYYRCEKHSIE